MIRMCVGTLCGPLATCARGVLRSAQCAAKIPENQVEDTRVLWVHFPCTVDDVVVRRVLRNEAHPGEDPPDLSVGADVDSGSVREFHVQIARQDVRRRAGDLGPYTVKLEKAAHDRRAWWSPCPDCSCVSAVFVANTVDSSVHVLGHDVVEPMQ